MYKHESIIVAIPTIGNQYFTNYAYARAIKLVDNGTGHFVITKYFDVIYLYQ
jgi:hypothetical protein